MPKQSLPKALSAGANDRDDGRVGRGLDARTYDDQQAFRRSPAVSDRTARKVMARIRTRT